MQSPQWRQQPRDGGYGATQSAHDIADLPAVVPKGSARTLSRGRRRTAQIRLIELEADANARSDVLQERGTGRGQVGNGGWREGRQGLTRLWSRWRSAGHVHTAARGLSRSELWHSLPQSREALSHSALRRNY